MTYRTSMPPWVKLPREFATVFKAFPAQAVGEGFKAAMEYFETRSEPEVLNEASYAVFLLLKAEIDAAYDACSKKSAARRNAVNSRWHTNDTNDTTDTTDTSDTDKDQDIDKDQNKNKIKTYIPPPPTPSEVETGGGGIEPEILNYAREAAKGADHPAAYERAIIERIQKAGFKTLEEVLEADRKRKADPAQRTSPTAHNYTERGYTDADYGEDFYVDLARENHRQEASP